MRPAGPAAPSRSWSPGHTGERIANHPAACLISAKTTSVCDPKAQNNDSSAAPRGLFSAFCGFPSQNFAFL